MNKPLREKIFRTAFYLWTAWCGAVWMAMNYLGFNRPRAPVPEQGRVYPYNDHGTIVYLTRAEHLIAFDLWPWYIAAAVIIGVIAKRFGAWNSGGD